MEERDRDLSLSPAPVIRAVFVDVRRSPEDPLVFDIQSRPGLRSEVPRVRPEAKQDVEMSPEELLQQEWKDCEEFVSSPYYRHWLKHLWVGDLVDVLDLKDKWYPAYIINIDESRERFFIHFQGWASKWDEWVEASSGRITPLGSHVYGVGADEEVSIRPSMRFKPNPFVVLRSYSYDKTMLNNIRGLYCNSSFSDAAIVVPKQYDDRGNPGLLQKVFVHRAMLQARCPGMLPHLASYEESKVGSVPIVQDQKSQPNQQVPLLFFSDIDVSWETFEDIIEFAYTGEILPVSGPRVKEMLKLFALFEVKDFAEVVSTWVNAFNVVDFLEAIVDDSQLTAFSRLQEQCIDCFRENASLIMVASGMRERLFRLPSNILVDVLQNFVPHLQVVAASGSKKRRRFSDPVFPPVRRRTLRSDSEERPEEHSQTTVSVEETKVMDGRSPIHITLDPFFMDSVILFRYISDMEGLYSSRDSKTCDMVIQVNGDAIHAHACILAIQSEFFAALVASPMQDKRYVTLDGLFRSRESFLFILRFIYTGFVGELTDDVAIDLLSSIDFFGLRSQVLKRACRVVIVNHANESNILELLKLSLHTINDSKLFSSLVLRFKRMVRRAELVQKIEDQQVLSAILKSIFEFEKEEGSVLESFSTLQKLVCLDHPQEILFLLSDECSSIMNGCDFARVDEVVEFAQAGVSDVTSSDAPLDCGEKTKTLLGGRTVVHSRNGELCNLISRHFTRIRL